MTEYRTVVCSHDCPDSCSARVGVKDGRIVSVQGDPDHPITRGILCGKVNRYAERVYSDLRIQTPLRRTGAKGEGKFAPIAWDEALDEIAHRFRETAQRHGAEAILPYSYGGTIGQVGMYIGHPFFYRLGATRLARTICVGSAVEGQTMTTGIGVASELERVADAKLILIWGVNAVATHIHLMPFVKDARAKGAKVVVIDPYRNATARQADWYIPIRPGTDAALALGMMHVILRERLQDSEFVERYTHGFDTLREACGAYTPQHASGITGIPAADIERLAQDYGREPAAFIRLGLGVSRHDNGGMMVRTIACLPTLTGKWAQRGGGFLCYAWGSAVQNNTFLKVARPQDPPARTVNMIKLGEVLTELRDPPIHALYVYNSNPAAIAPEQAKVHTGLAREDLFVAVHEQTFTDTTDFADIVLPATTFMEHDDLLSSYGQNYVQVSRPAIAPVGQAKSNLEVFQLLAKRMGFTEPVFSMGFDELVRNLFKPDVAARDGFDVDALLAGKTLKFKIDPAPWERGLKTPSGKFEFHSALMAAKGQPAAPAHVPSAEGHADNAQRRRYPLQLLTPPSQHYLNSSFGDAKTSRKLEDTPRIKVHPTDATARGLADGAACRAFNDRGECFLTVEVTGDVQPGVVVAESVWWPKWMRERKGINQLTSAVFTDLGDCAQLHNALVEVEPAKDSAQPPRSP